MLTTAGAIALATKWHDLTEKTDPGSGAPYISHPIRVMKAVAAAGFDERYQRVAVLHDTIEDTDLTVDLLREAGATEEEIEAVLSVTKPLLDGPYAERVTKAALNEIGGVVKGFDMLDNSNPERMRLLALVDPKKADRLIPQYAAGLALLEQLRPGWQHSA